MHVFDDLRIRLDEEGELARLAKEDVGDDFFANTYMQGGAYILSKVCDSVLQVL